MESHNNILREGIIYDYNRYGELDFGFGFYLTPSKKLAESYITRLYSWRDEKNTHNNPVILEYQLSPLEWFINSEYQCAVFPNFDDAFANFVFQNRFHSDSGVQYHNYDVIYGVMSDSNPTALLLNYRIGEINKNEVLQGFKKSTSMKQLSLHNQELCDMITLTEAYEYDVFTKSRKELAIS